MKLIRTSEVNFDKLLEDNVDCLICASGFEERATYLASRLDLNSIKCKFVVDFDSFTNEIFRKRSDNYFRSNNFKRIKASSNEGLNFEEIFAEIISAIDKEDINILFDYSSMTRLWYSSALSFVRDSVFQQTITLYFGYSFSNFAKPINSNLRNLHIDPIPGFSKISSPDKPTALIIGLGYEKARAFGLSEYFDAEPYLFFTDNLNGNSFQKYVKDANKSIIDFVKEENLFEYSLDHLESTESLLFSVCNSLNRDYRIVLAPTGPKPFALLCLLTSLRLDNIDVWRISAGTSVRPINMVPTGKISIYKAVFI